VLQNACFQNDNVCLFPFHVRVSLKQQSKRSLMRAMFGPSAWSRLAPKPIVNGTLAHLRQESSAWRPPLHLWPCLGPNPPARSFTTCRRQLAAESPYAKPPTDLDSNITKEEKDHFDKVEAKNKQGQIRTPWMREGSDTPPVAKKQSPGAMTKG